MNAVTSEIGIVRQMMNVARQRPKKAMTTRITNMNAYITESLSELMESIIDSEPSTMISMFMSGGKVFSMEGRVLLISLIISTVFAPDCFWTITVTPRLPFTRTS